MQGKILESVFIPEEGYCEVTKQSKYGTFTHGAICDKEDVDVFNEWDGCFLAEYKCDLDILKMKTKEFKARLRGMENAYSALKQTVEEDNAVMVKFLQQIKFARRDVEGLEETYNILREDYMPLTEKILEERRKFRQKIVDQFIE